MLDYIVGKMGDPLSSLYIFCSCYKVQLKQQMSWLSKMLRERSSVLVNTHSLGIIVFWEAVFHFH